MKHWKNEYEYQRILEILEAYWLEEPEEMEVVVDMHFLKSNGETQDKHIVWRNPKYPKAPDESKPMWLTAMDILMEERDQDVYSK